MKITLQITIVFSIVALGESFVPPPKVDPCSTVKCKAGTTCVVKYGRALCRPVPQLCRPPLTIHQCKVAPCDVTKCPAYPTAKCVNNYCGGCFAEFYLGGRKVNCKIVKPNPCAAVLCFIGHKCVVRNGKPTCEPTCKSNSDCKQQGSFCNTASGVCQCTRFCTLQHTISVCGSDGKQYSGLCQLNAAACEKKTTITTAPCKDVCLLHAEPGPCKGNIPRYFYNSKSRKCEQFFYGGCGGNGNNFATKTDCEAKCHQGPCPPDKPLFYCFIRPCQFATCPAFPSAKCVDNICGGCKADFYDGSKKVDCELRSKRELPPQLCRPPLTIHYCIVAPCDVTKCPAYPTATCVNNHCGGCFADFFVNDKKVKCNIIRPKRQLPQYHHFPTSCAAVTCFIDHTCVVRNGKATCEPIVALPKCKSHDDCEQQGSYCNTQSRVCQCQRFCPLHHAPVCDPDGKKYSNDCFLNMAACEKKTTIPLVSCGLIDSS